MSVILDGLQGAIELIISLDKDTYSVIALSLFVSLIATGLASFFGVTLGIFLGIKNFIGKGLIIRIVYLFTSIPPVIVGLLVYVLLSRRGVFGNFKLLYTPTAMIIAQFFLTLPIITSYVYNITNDNAEPIIKLGKSLGVNRVQSYLMLLRELRNPFVVAIILGYGRAISEVGAVMMVGGNIMGHTRVMTTSIMMLQGMGQFDKALAFGIVLLLISFIIQSLLHLFQSRSSYSRSLSRR